MALLRARVQKLLDEVDAVQSSSIWATTRLELGVELTDALPTEASQLGYDPGT